MEYVIAVCIVAVLMSIQTITDKLYVIRQIQRLERPLNVYKPKLDEQDAKVMMQQGATYMPAAHAWCLPNGERLFINLETGVTERGSIL